MMAVFTRLCKSGSAILSHHRRRRGAPVRKHLYPMSIQGTRKAAGTLSRVTLARSWPAITWCSSD